MKTYDLKDQKEFNDFKQEIIEDIKEYNPVNESGFPLNEEDEPINIDWYRMQDKYHIFCEIAKTLVIDLIENAKQHPAEVRDMLQYTVTDIVDNYLMSKNWKVEFDSPMGEYAATVLTKMGLVAEWDGEQYHRGTTTVYFPKDKVSKKDAENINKVISMLSILTTNDELNDLFDEDTTITLMNKEEE